MIAKFDTNEEYHASRSISASGLKTIAKQSVEYFINQPSYSSKAMELGTAVHTLLLEGSKEFQRIYYIMPNIGDLRKTENKILKKEHLEQAGEKTLLTFQEGEIIKSILANFEKNEVAKKYCTGIVEQSHYGEMDGVPIRVRPDCRGDNWIGDVKTCQDSSPKAFKRDVYNWGYHIQATFYCDALGVDPRNFGFVVTATKAPYLVEVYALNEDMIEQGRRAYLDALDDWRFYLDTGIAKGYQTEFITDDNRLIL